ncbi:hypothetical protein K438DRAFT_2015199 [Mycena galopus ATCC 62051]|nr:hypothetical protein K438DRAFT_2015199 [Mycena galopus ATCC 62051]
MSALDSVTGALLVGTWASSLLYMAEMLQATYYFRHFKHDDWRLKTFVTIVFVIDTISALGDYACVYLYTITHAGDLAYLNKQHWPVPLYLISTSLVAIQVQSYLTLRYWRFTKNTIVVGFLSLVILASFCGGVATGLVIVLFPAFKDRMKVKVSGTIWIITSVCADSMIAGAMVYEFQKVKSKFLEGRCRMQNTLNRLVVITIQTGSATAVIALGYLIDEESNVPVGIMYCIGRVYVLSMFLNLNLRVSGKSMLGTARTPTIDLDLGTIAFLHSNGTSRMDGIGGTRFRSASSCLSSAQGQINSRLDLNVKFKTDSTNSHTAEDSRSKNDMAATDTSKTQSELVLV